jgi:hypothetical protein
MKKYGKDTEEKMEAVCESVAYTYCSQSGHDLGFLRQTIPDACYAMVVSA